MVFRPQSTGAMVWALLLAGSLAASFAVSRALGDWEGVRNDLVWIWLEQLSWRCSTAVFPPGGYMHRISTSSVDS
jgi:hypothetical protein